MSDNSFETPEPWSQDELDSLKDFTFTCSSLSDYDIYRVVVTDPQGTVNNFEFSGQVALELSKIIVATSASCSFGFSTAPEMDSFHSSPQPSTCEVLIEVVKRLLVKF